VVTFFSMIFSLGLVLGLMFVALHVLRRYTGSTVATGRVPLEVVQRIGLGPRQGIALVRVGDRVIAVSMGEGGVRPLMEVEGEARESLLRAATPAALPAMVGRPAAVPDFATALRTAVKGSFRSALLLAALAGGLAATAPLVQAQALPATPVQATRPQPGEPTLQAEGAALERLDQTVPRLAPQMDLRVGGGAEEGGLRLSGTVGIVVMMGLMTMLPTLLLMMTGFTRILIVLHFLRQALGTQTAPPAHLIAGLALLLTGFVMAPTLREFNSVALDPWLAGQIEQGEMIKRGVVPFREFMVSQTRDRDIEAFVQMSDAPAPSSIEEVPLTVLMAAFVTSELKSAFQIGFALFLPFIVIDIVVASVLMSMGMMMLPPVMIALPFKLLLFVLVDGWTLVVQGLISSFH
jgi:flagellar biosynthesis protein FliP